MEISLVQRRCKVNQSRAGIFMSSTKGQKQSNLCVYITVYEGNLCAKHFGTSRWGAARKSHVRQRGRKWRNQARKIKSRLALADQSNNVSLNWSQNSRQAYQVERHAERKQETQTEGRERCASRLEAGDGSIWSNTYRLHLVWLGVRPCAWTGFCWGCSREINLSSCKTRRQTQRCLVAKYVSMQVVKTLVHLHVVVPPSAPGFGVTFFAHVIVAWIFSRNRAPRASLPLSLPVSRRVCCFVWRLRFAFRQSSKNLSSTCPLQS